MSTLLPQIGSRISLISRADIRYEGLLFTVDPVACTIALSNVQSYGTEGRETSCPVGPQTGTYDYILFRGSDIKDIKILPISSANAAVEKSSSGSRVNNIKPTGAAVFEAFNSGGSGSVISQVKPAASSHKPVVLKESTNVQSKISSKPDDNNSVNTTITNTIHANTAASSEKSSSGKRFSHYQASTASADTVLKQQDAVAGTGNSKQTTNSKQTSVKKAADDKSSDNVVSGGRKKEAKQVPKVNVAKELLHTGKQSKSAVTADNEKYNNKDETYYNNSSKSRSTSYSASAANNRRYNNMPSSAENYEMNGVGNPHIVPTPFNVRNGPGPDMMYGRYNDGVDYNYRHPSYGGGGGGGGYHRGMQQATATANPWQFRGAPPGGNFRNNMGRGAGTAAGSGGGGQWTAGKNVPSRLDHRFNDSPGMMPPPRHYGQQPTMIYRSSARLDTRHQGNKKQETEDYSAEYDFETANSKFEELKCQFSKINMNDVESEHNNDVVVVKNNDGLETSDAEAGPSGVQAAAAAAEDGPSENSKAFYDKAKSFFDNISCETHEKSKIKRNNWMSERKLNSETFGMNAARSAGAAAAAYRSGRGHGHYVQGNRDDSRNIKNYRYGYGRY